MVVFVFTLIGLILIALQSTVLMFNPIWPFSPDLYYILVAYLAYRFDLMRGLIILFPLSWALDVFSGVVLGMYPAICFSAFFLLKVMAAKMPVRESLYQVPLIGVSYLVVHKSVYTVFSFLETGVLVPWSWPLILVRVLILVALAVPLFRLFERINKGLQQKFKPFSMLRVRSGNRYRPESE